MSDSKTILIVEARFYDDIADEMARGAIAAIESAGYTWERIAVPGSFEIPAAIGFAMDAAEDGNGPDFAGVVALGCVIRGETDHYDHICREVSRALMDMAARDGVPLGFGVLTCENRSQAWRRAAVDQLNKGGDAADACIRMIDIRDRFAAVRS